MDPWGDRARQAAESVRRLFGRRLLGMPFTHLARVDHPVGRPVFGPWNYWWQAHYIDALVDEALREQAHGDHARARSARSLAHRTLVSIGIRNVGRFTNAYYDDMAWLLLAAQRLETRGGSAGPLPRATRAHVGRALRRTIGKGETPDLGGGVFWNTAHDFKNLPATGPVALFRARVGDLDRAQALVDWAYAHLHDGSTGLFRDGIEIQPDGSTRLTPHVFTYNQGTVLGTLTELASRGGPDSARRAADLVDAVRTHLTTDSAGRLALRAHGDGDGGLFTGILVRYLALAARSPVLDSPTRATAAQLVRDNAHLLWAGRQSLSLPKALRMPSAQITVFSPDPARPASESQPPGIPLELSSQLQAWTILEAAASLAE
jgi:predicted alpha-1,6-mannanase (GH76 family)